MPALNLSKQYMIYSSDQSTGKLLLLHHTCELAELHECYICIFLWQYFLCCFRLRQLRDEQEIEPQASLRLHMQKPFKTLRKTFVLTVEGKPSPAVHSEISQTLIHRTRMAFHGTALGFEAQFLSCVAQLVIPAIEPQLLKKGKFTKAIWQIMLKSRLFTIKKYKASQIHLQYNQSIV